MATFLFHIQQRTIVIILILRFLSQNLKQFQFWKISLKVYINGLEIEKAETIESEVIHSSIMTAFHINLC